MTDGSPKSAVELAMEKLAKQDAESGDAVATLTAEQRQVIADARRAYEAKVAETRILHDAKLAATMDPEARRALQEEFQRDLGRLASLRDKKIAAATAE